MFSVALGRIVLVGLLGGLIFGGASLAGKSWAANQYPMQNRHNIILVNEKEQYDDPAVAACEYDLRKRVSPVLPGYKRHQAKIEGLRVTLSFTTTALNTRPVPNTHVCQFKLKDNQYRFLEDEKKEDDADCLKLKNNSEAQVSSIMNGSSPTYIKRAQLGKLLSKMNLCKEKMKKTLFPYLDFATKTGMPLAVLGIYPIDQDKTKLQPIDNN